MATPCIHPRVRLTVELAVSGELQGSAQVAVMVPETLSPTAAGSWDAVHTPAWETLTEPSALTPTMRVPSQIREIWVVSPVGSITWALAWASVMGNRANRRVRRRFMISPRGSRCIRPRLLGWHRSRYSGRRQGRWGRTGVVLDPEDGLARKRHLAQVDPLFHDLAADGRRDRSIAFHGPGRLEARLGGLKPQGRLVHLHPRGRLFVIQRLDPVVLELRIVVCCLGLVRLGRDLAALDLHEELSRADGVSLLYAKVHDLAHDLARKHRGVPGTERPGRGDHCVDRHRLHRDDGGRERGLLFRDIGIPVFLSEEHIARAEHGDCRDHGNAGDNFFIECLDLFFYGCDIHDVPLYPFCILTLPF